MEDQWVDIDILHLDLYIYTPTTFIHLLHLYTYYIYTPTTFIHLTAMSVPN